MRWDTKFHTNLCKDVQIMLTNRRTGRANQKKPSRQCIMNITPCCCKVQESKSAKMFKSLGTDLTPEGRQVYR